MDIYNFLENHKGISLHMPAHKNRADFIYNDLTEIYGADNLRNPQGIIKKSQEKAAEILDAKKAFYLVNGASSGLMAAVMSAGDGEILIDRNCHESVINGLIMSGGMPVYAYPEADEIFEIPKPITEDCISDKYNTFVYTAVTYYGKACNSDALRKTLGNSLMIADEAHGAHFYFASDLKKYRATAADINILSFHKSLPSLTQTAVMITKGERADYEFLKKCKNLVTTTSPSYPLMASLDYAVENGKKVYEKEAKNIKKEIESNSDILVYNSDDPWKLLLNFRNCNTNAEEIDRKLREKYNIFCEGIFGDNILFMMSPYNTEEEIILLKNAVISLSKEKGEKKKIISVPIIKSETVITPKEAFFAQGDKVEPEKAIGRISKENVTLFPPCVPIITVGERITEEAAHYLKLSERNINVVR